MNNLVVKTNGIPLAHCVQRKWFLKIYVNLSRKDATDEFEIYRNTSLNGKLLLRKLFLTWIITRTHEANLDIGVINEVFFRKI